MTEDKIQHTDALRLCNELTDLHHSISSLQHELVLHYSATGVPPGKTLGKVHVLERQIESVQAQLDLLEAELKMLDR